LKLDKEAQKYYDSIVDEYGIKDEAGKLILLVALEAFSRMREAQDAIKKHGIVTLDSSNRPKPNPACQVERDSRSQMLQAIKLLKLDITLE